MGQRENTDREGRLQGIARSFADYFRGQDEALKRAITTAENEIACGRGNVEQRRRDLARLQKQQTTLYNGFENSSFRQYLKSRDRNLDLFHCQERRALPSGVDFGLSRATTSTTRVATQLRGYAAVFNVWSPAYYRFHESIKPGAFAKALRTDDTRLLWNHNPDFVFARNTSMTLELEEDDHGLHFVAHLLRFDGPSYHLARLVDRGDVSQCSFAFRIPPGGDRWTYAQRPGEVDRREILEVSDLDDVSVVVYPWYPTTSVSAVFETVQRAEPVQVTPPKPQRRLTRDEFWDELDEIDEQIMRDEQLNKIEADLRRLDIKAKDNEMDRIIQKCRRAGIDC